MKKQYPTEQIVTKLHQVDVDLAKTLAEPVINPAD